MSTARHTTRHAGAYLNVLCVLVDEWEGLFEFLDQMRDVQRLAAEDVDDRQM